MSAIVEQVVNQRHTLVRGAKQYDFVPLHGDVVVVTCYAPRMTFRREVSAMEARALWKRLKSQGYVEW